VNRYLSPKYQNRRRDLDLWSLDLELLQHIECDWKKRPTTLLMFTVQLHTAQHQGA